MYRQEAFCKTEAPALSVRQEGILQAPEASKSLLINQPIASFLASNTKTLIMIVGYTGAPFTRDPPDQTSAWSWTFRKLVLRHVISVQSQYMVSRPYLDFQSVPKTDPYTLICCITATALGSLEVGVQPGDPPCRRRTFSVARLHISSGPSFLVRTWILSKGIGRADDKTPM